MSRKIVDAKDLSTDQLVYFKSHAKATYLSDGRTVEEAVQNMALPEEIQLILNTLYSHEMNEDYNEDFAI